MASKRTHVRAGRFVRARGALRPRTAGTLVKLQLKRDGRWRYLDRDRAGARGRWTLAGRVSRPGSHRLRLVVVGRPGVGRVMRRLGRVNVYRVAHASWYGPGLYGNLTGCGGRLGYSSLGVAHKSLPCGTRVTFRHRGRTVRVPVIDRGPYVAGREYDLTAATARRLSFSGHGAILTTR